MKKLAKILALAAAVLMLATGCKKLPEFTDGKTTTVSPTVAINVYTQRVTGIGDTKAYFEGFIDNTEISGLTVTVGFCWNTTGNPTLNDDHITTELNENFHFNCTAYGLVSNTTYYVKAWAIIGTENPDSAIYGNEESFTTQGSGGGSGDAPTGAINGLFSVSDTKQVYFSKGNLQYQASMDKWRFADNQYDIIGEANANISSYYTGWIDLFGWGTSGYNHGAVCYQPWSTSENNSDYYAYGNSNYNLSDQTGQADWGYNPISNGGNNFRLWRTLTNEEWVYLIDTRNTSSGIRYAKAQVNDIKGVILLPDNWNSDTYSLSNTNTSYADFTTNIITSTSWNILEQAGAVFLPTAGYRINNTMSYVGSQGRYWSNTVFNANYAYNQLFASGFELERHESRYIGISVRLVHDAE